MSICGQEEGPSLQHVFKAPTAVLDSLNDLISGSGFVSLRGLGPRKSTGTEEEQDSARRRTLQALVLATRDGGSGLRVVIAVSKGFLV